ncbi:MAG: NAD(P)H-dependent oxidoreductase [Porphyromonas sp.]|nr:NAD(P)H-dependent oxidoreductase [Porphyromonas sp.]
MKVLVILSHSYQAQSVSNVAIAEEYKQAGFELRNLEELYPAGNFDIAAEQAALEAADVVILQHPIFWYNMPPTLKCWMDEVWTYGWAYGSEGSKLAGKKLLHAYTTGGARDKYTDEMVKGLSAPLRASAAFTSMEFLEPMGVFGLLAMTNPNAAADARAFAQSVIARIKSL